ncbi:MAG: hypothetical protein CMJ58_03720 [Planctomycetaceae bacterium]|nr:hypothetical protein [Planctomycetaceae bacterium]
MASSLQAFIERVLASGLLQPAFVELADCGAQDADFASAPPLPEELRQLLSWRNGLNLDEIRLYGLGRPAGRRIEQMKINAEGEAILFASDPAGFQYLLRADGSVISFDHDGGKVITVAESIEDFLRNYVFGARAAEFGGEEWANEVRTALEDS